ncbi:MAG: serine hydrolase domain-containing protein [Bacteroidota bacterium]
MMIKKLLLVIFSIVLVGSCKQGETNKQEATQDYSEFENGLSFQHVYDSVIGGKSFQERLDFHKVPGVSVAIFEKGEIVWRKEYGVLKSDSNRKVNSSTKFQAASISKAVAALGVFKLVEQFNLDIDTDVNEYLKKWKVDYGEFSNEEKVTIRRLLSHSAGINVAGFYGYSKSSSIPSLLQLLDGKGNNEKVEVQREPGTEFLYSGGGYSILEQLVEDVSGVRFEEYMNKEIFEPLDMSNSTYNLFPRENISYAHDTTGNTHPEGWLVYPELTGAGLWTTPSDMVKFCVAIENSFYTIDTPLISDDYAKEMLKPSIEWANGIWWGLGVALKGENENTFYWHSGSNPGGYRCMMLDFYKKRTGIIIMTNADNGAALYNEIIDSFFSYKGIPF